MKIPNYDSYNKEPNKRTICPFLNEDYRMIISGQSNSGKTNLLVCMLRSPLVYYDKIIMYTPNHSQSKLEELKSIMDDISEKVGYNILEIKSADEIMDTNKYHHDNRKIVIFDDLVNCSDKIQSKIANHFTDGRHHNISPIYISQSYYDIPSKIRLNSSHMCLYQPLTKTHVNLIAKENLIDSSLFDKLGRYEFLFIDKEKKTCHKNFDEVII